MRVNIVFGLFLSLICIASIVAVLMNIHKWLPVNQERARMALWFMGAGVLMGIYLMFKRFGDRDEEIEEY
jgi:hypothetical protein